jgi:hypothetical protein
LDFSGQAAKNCRSVAGLPRRRRCRFGVQGLFSIEDTFSEVSELVRQTSPKVAFPTHFQFFLRSILLSIEFIQTLFCLFFLGLPSVPSGSFRVISPLMVKVYVVYVAFQLFLAGVPFLLVATICLSSGLFVFIDVPEGWYVIGSWPRI